MVNGQSAPRPRGFTLLELILVMVVISAVLAISAPSLRGFFASRQTADLAGHILALTKYARSTAIVRGQPCRLNVDSAAGRFWLTVQETGAFVSPTSEMGRQHQLPEGASLKLECQARPQAEEEYIQFEPSGRCDVATITIRGRQGDEYLVTTASGGEPYRVITPLEAP